MGEIKKVLKKWWLLLLSLLLVFPFTIIGMIFISVLLYFDLPVVFSYILIILLSSFFSTLPLLIYIIKLNASNRSRSIIRFYFLFLLFIACAIFFLMTYRA